MRLAALVLAFGVGAGCTHTTTVKGGPPGAELWIGEESVELGDEPVQLEVPHTYLDPELELYVDEDDAPELVATVPRTQVDPVTAAGLFSCAALTTPACMGAGFCLANPGVFMILLAPFGELFFDLGLNALSSSITRPGWPTVPVVMGCALLGLLPLAGLPYALRVPDEIELPSEPAASAAAPPLVFPEGVPF